MNLATAPPGGLYSDQEETMGKKKSVALITLVTVVLLGLLFICFAPTFQAKTPYDFRSLLGHVELSTDLGGGYSTVYYPEGVISQSEYDLIKSLFTEAESKGDTSGLENPADYTKHKGVYLSEDLYEDGALKESFVDGFDAAFRTLQRRFADKGYADYTVAVQDDYSILVEVPYGDETPGDLFNTFAYGGSLYLTAETVTSVKSLEPWTEADIKGFSVASAGDSGYAVVVKFTKEGRQRFKEMTASMSESEQTTLYLYVGTNQVLSVGGMSGEQDTSTLYISGSFTDRANAQTAASVLDSALDEENAFSLVLQYSQVNTFEPTAGTHTALALTIAIGVLFVAVLVVSLVLYKGMGLAHAYAFLTYILALILCVSLIGGMVVDLAGVAAIVLASAVMTGFNWFAYRNIRDEFYKGKTLTAAIKSGYRRSLALTIDVHAILAVAALVVMLIVTGSAHYAAAIFLAGILLSAACTLGVTRFYLYMFMAQPKNKIAFCNFRREEADEDEE